MYYKFFGLRDAPFQFQPSTTLFLSAAHLEGLAALQWACQEPSGLTLLVGEVGTGKTMLIHSLIARMKDDKVRIAQVSNPTLSFEQMLAVIIEQLGIRPVGQGKLACLQALNTFVADPAAAYRVILIFDEAQGLSDETLEELRLLSNSRPPQRHALQIILVGQPELVERLTDPKLRALNQRIGARALLRPLRGAEIRDYVNCLLRAQGARRELFSPEAMDRVAQLSGGLPRKINNLCHNALLQAYLERSAEVQPRHVQAAGAELDNLIDASSYRYRLGFSPVRRAWYWMLGEGKPVMAAGLTALVVMAAALAFAFMKGRDAGLAAHIGTSVEHAQDAAEFSHPVPTIPDQDDESRTSRSVHYAARRPSPRPAAAGSPPSRVLPASRAPGTLASADTSSAASAAVPPEPDRLTYAQQRRLAYEIRRARSSLDAGRYTNVIYHSRRALLIDPANAEVRDLLQRAQAAQSSPEKSASVQEAPAQSVAPESGQAPTNSRAATASGTDQSFASTARAEISEGDAYMQSGKYDLALRKFLTAAVLDPGNQSLPDRIKRAQAAKDTMESLGVNSARGSASRSDGAQ